MPFERLVGLNVSDDQRYAAYRAGMTPILARFGGKFGYDFKIAEVLQSETPAPINRLFTISFPNEAAMKAFFSNDEYLAVRKQHFEPAVADATIIATYER